MTGKPSVWLAGLFALGCGTSGIRGELESGRVPAPVGASAQALSAVPLLSSPANKRPSTDAPTDPRAGRRDLSPSDLAFLGHDILETRWTAAVAADYKPRSWTEKRALIAFLARSDQLRGAWRRRQAARHGHSQTLHLQRLVEQLESFSSRPDRPKPVQQLPNAESLQGRVVDADVAIEAVRFQITAWDLMVRFTRAFHQATYEGRAAGVLSEGVKLARRLVRVAEARVTAASGSTADVLRAEMRVEAMRRRVRTARERRASAMRRLAALLGITKPLSPGTSRRLPRLPGLKGARNQARTDGPDVLLAAQRLARGEAMLSLAELKILPELSTQASETGGDPVRSRFRGAYSAGAPYLEELRDRVAAAGRMLAQARTLVPAAAERQHATLSDALRRVTLYKHSQMPRARKALAATEAEYRVGRRSYLELDDAQQLWLDTHLGYHAAVRDAHVAFAELARVMGEKQTQKTTPKKTPNP